MLKYINKILKFFGYRLIKKQNYKKKKLDLKNIKGLEEEKLLAVYNKQKGKYTFEELNNKEVGYYNKVGYSTKEKAKEMKIVYDELYKKKHGIYKDGDNWFLTTVKAS